MGDSVLRAPILMLTARDAVDDRVVGLDAHADDYLVKWSSKPLSVRTLSKRALSYPSPSLPVQSTPTPN
jgi:two-component system, OmpR family, response regulator